MIESRAALASLLEVLQVAIDRTMAAGDRPWESGPVALSWMEHEIAPLVARLSEVGLPAPCPICRKGEEFDVYPPEVGIWQRRPLGESYTCGHWVKFSVSLLEPAEYDVLMPMNSGEVSVIGSATITNRPQASAFRPARIVLFGHPDHWRIDDVRVGNRSQLSGPGGISGALFSCAVVDPPVLWFEVVQTAMDFVLEVSYVGPLPEGEIFGAAILGVSADGDLARRRREIAGEISPAQMNDIVTRVRAAAAEGRVSSGSRGHPGGSIDDRRFDR